MARLMHGNRPVGGVMDGGVRGDMLGLCHGVGDTESMV
jgi:hypothetical protein